MTGGRLCACLLEAHKITLKQNFSIPRIDELLDYLHGIAVFPPYDFVGAFFQIALHSYDRRTTTFHRKLCPFGSFIHLPNNVSVQARFTKARL